MDLVLRNASRVDIFEKECLKCSQVSLAAAEVKREMTFLYEYRYTGTNELKKTLMDEIISVYHDILHQSREETKDRLLRKQGDFLIMLLKLAQKMNRRRTNFGSKVSSVVYEVMEDR